MIPALRILLFLMVLGAIFATCGTPAIIYAASVIGAAGILALYSTID